ncbi:hypothetical protein BY458DRAFT_88474 [Sporodiniella umbellata]|nr:hypothetical protein BY458DRAFT_88474 [Sporodiniella umbellata]
MIARFPFAKDKSFFTTGSSMNLPPDITEEYLVKLSKRTVLAHRMRNRKFALWNNLLDQAFYYQDVLKNKDRASR